MPTTSAVAIELPTARGPLTEGLVRVLRSDPTSSVLLPEVGDGTDPYGADLQAALYICYELHYRGFDAVSDAWEWNCDLLRFRAALEKPFLRYLRDQVDPGSDAVAEMKRIDVESTRDGGPSHHLSTQGTWAQMQEYFVHRSLYHLKEADPHAWAIPRLTGQTKASFVAVEFDEYGGGHRDRMHQQLFADLLDSAELDSTYLGYFDWVPAETLATVNVMSLFGLHRGLRAAAVGHFAATEISSSPGSARLVRALRSMGAPTPCVHFYAEHVEADAVHEQVVRHDVVGSLIAELPELESDVVFGMRVADHVEARMGDLVLAAWSGGGSSLLLSL